MSKGGCLLDLKKLEVPTSSITEVKRSPMDVFDQEKLKPVYIYLIVKKLHRLR